MIRKTHIRSAACLALMTTSLTCSDVSWASIEDIKDPIGNNFNRHHVKLVVNQTLAGVMSADTNKAGHAKVTLPALRSLLSNYISPDQDRILEKFGYESVLLEQLRQEGFPVVYDVSTQTIRARLPGAEKIAAEKTANAQITVPQNIAVSTITAKSIGDTDLEDPKPPIAEPSFETAQIGDLESTFEAAVADEDFFPLEVPLTVNRSFLGDISAQATLTGSAKIDVKRLRELLSDRLSPQQSDILANYGDSYVLLDTLNAQGFLIVYDPADLTIKMTLVKEGVSVLSLSGRSIDNIDLNSFEKPANFSAGASFIMRPKYVHESEFGDTGFAPLSANMRGFVAAGGFNSWAFVYELDAIEGRERTVRRGDFTLIKDDFRRALRFQAGDIRPSISGFQNGFNIFGVGVERNYGAIQPFRNLRPGGRTQFALERPARVSFEVNGVVTQSELLEPGEFDIRDFPLLTGSNDVRIIVDDEFGTREVGSYSTFVDSDLLSSGTTLFGANLGVLRKGGNLGFGPNYDNDLLGTAFYEKAVSDSLTLGIQGEASSKGAYLGGKAVYGRGQSIFALEAAMSEFKNSDMGHSAAFQYRYRPKRVRSKINHDIVAQVLHRSQSFQTIGSLGNPRGKIWQVSVNDSIRMNRYSVNLNGTWQRDNSDETTSFSPSVSIPLDGVSLSFGYQGVYRKSSDKLDSRLFVALSKNFGAAGTVRSRTRTGPWESSVEWQRLSNRSVGAWSGRAGYLVSQAEDELNLGATYIASRAEFDVSHSSTLESGFGKAKASSTDARIGLGFGYADGALAFGRPVSDGFVILKGHPSLKGKKIDAKQRSGRLEAIRDRFGPALIPLNSPYSERVHRVSVQNLPAGLDIGTDEIKVFPSQNSGYKIRVGSDPSALVIGKLITNDDSPIALSVGKLVSTVNPEAEPIEFFTNRTGRFVAERVPPGRYTMILMPEETVITEVDIGAGEEGVVQLGTITIKEAIP